MAIGERNAKSASDRFPTASDLLLFAKTHNDKCNDQAVQRDGFDQRESDPHVLANSAFRFGLTRDRLIILPKIYPMPTPAPANPAAAKPIPNNAAAAASIVCPSSLV